MSDRLAVFNNGRIEQVGAPADVYERPATRFVAGFVGTSNLLTGAVAEAIIGRAGTFTVRPEKIRLAEPYARGRRRTRTRRSGASATSSISVPTPASSSRSTPGRTSWSLGRTSRRPRPRRSRCRARLSASCGSDSTISPSRTGRDRTDRRRRTGCRHGGCWGSSRARRSSSAACSSTAARRVHRAERRRRPGAAARSRREPGGVRGAERGGRDARAERADGELGSTQGQTINVLAWPGYVENGSTYPEYDWVTDFQKESGCTVKPQTFGTSDEAYTLFSTNPEQFDVVSASGDASLRLVRGGFVQPVNLDLFKSYPDIFPALKNKPYNTVDGVPYGVPHGRGSNLLMWRTDQVTPAPTTLGPDVRPGERLQGQHLRRADLHRRRGRRPDEDQARRSASRTRTRSTTPSSQAAVNLLKQQKPAVTQRWVDYLKQMDDFRSGHVERRDDLAGHRQPAQAGEAAGQGRPDQADRRRDRLVRHVDDQLEDEEPRLRVRVHRPPRPRPRSTPRSPTTSARRRATPSRAR